MLKIQVILLLIIYIPNSSCDIDDLYNIGIAVYKLYSLLNEFELNSDRDITNVTEFCTFNSEKSIRLKDHLNDIHKQLTAMEQFLEPVNLPETFRLWQISIYVCLDRVQELAGNIDELYNDFQKYRQSSYLDSHNSLVTFLETVSIKVIQENSWMRKNVIEGNRLVPKYKHLIQAISHEGINLRPELCNGPEMVATAVHRLYKIVMIAEIKTNVILAMARMYSLNSDWKTVNLMARDAFENRFALYTQEFTEALHITELFYLRACDPTDNIWNRDKNFYELVRTFQSTIFRYHWGVCKYGTCNDILRIRNRCEAKSYNERSFCSDQFGSCTYLGAINACVLKTGPYRFQYLNSTKLGALGHNFECPKNAGDIIDDYTNNYVYATCQCNCHSSRNKISLLIMQSNVASNKVISGLRFIRHNRILYIQPREGSLNAYGYIRRFSERWISLPLDIESSHIHPINRTNRIFFLDDLRLPAYYALAGIKFNEVKREKKTGFAIEIFGVPFDYNSGKLYPQSEFLVSKRASNENLGEKLFFKPVNPIHSTVRYTPSPERFKYVALNRSTLRSDFGQSTLPFFDGVLVEPNPPTVLGGIGIFHKAAEGYAGFISLRLFPIGYGHFFKDFQSIYMVDGKLSFNHSETNERKHPSNSSFK